MLIIGGTATRLTLFSKKVFFFQLKIRGKVKGKSRYGEGKKLCHPDRISLGLDKTSVLLAEPL